MSLTDPNPLMQRDPDPTTQIIREEPASAENGGGTAYTFTNGQTVIVTDKAVGFDGKFYIDKTYYTDYPHGLGCPNDRAVAAAFWVIYNSVDSQLQAGQGEVIS